LGVKNLPLEKGRKLVEVFEKFGWISHRGKNHFVLTHPAKSPDLNISIPDHKHVDRFLLKSELRKAGITEDEFCREYRNC
jgi:hypothetical protein